MLDNKEKYLHHALIGLVALFVYFSFGNLEISILNFLHIDYEQMSKTFKVIYLMVCDLVEMAIFIGLFYPSLKENLKDLKENHETYFKTYFKYWLIILGVMMVSNVLIMLLTDNVTSNNEELVRNLIVKSPIYAYFSGIIYAPLVEEIIFRKSIRNMIKNDTLFILISGFIFGGLHVVTGYSGVKDLLYLIPYCTPGIIFAYIYVKSDNIFVSTAIHFMHNGILIAMQMFIYLFLT